MTNQFMQQIEFFSRHVQIDRLKNCKDLVGYKKDV